MTVSINGTSGLVFNDASTQNTSAFTGGFAFRNRIINGAMQISQRVAVATPVTVGATTFSVDRFFGYRDSGATVTAQQSTTAPTGFSNSLLFTCSTGSAPSAGQQVVISQRIEGFNTVDLSFGTASAATVTLSFWVRSSVTGTYCAYLVNSSYNRTYVSTYTISAANTWEQKTITVAGDTAGTWVGGTNGIGLTIGFCLGSGSNFTTTAGAWATGEYQQTSAQAAWSSTTGATFYITGVQLEKGSTATSFDYRPYGTELALCQRYYQYLPKGTWEPVVAQPSGASAIITCMFKVTMRATPTITLSSISVYSGGTPVLLNSGSDSCNISYGAAVGNSQWLTTMSAEL
jgi:hypothetical protein